MARWRLTESHYLKVVGVTWEDKQLSQQTGEQAVVRMPVPMLLSIDDAKHINDKENGWIIVANKQDPMHRGDYIFEGSPTPAMEPLDEEARAISAKLAKASAYQPDPGIGFSEGIMKGLEDQLSKIASQNTQAGIDPAKFEALQQQMADMMAQNQQLLQALIGSLNKPAPEAARRA